MDTEQVAMKTGLETDGLWRRCANHFQKWSNRLLGLGGTGSVGSAPSFFIIGMQKSGTYWLTALLNSHPQIRCFPSQPGHADGTGEAHLFDVLARMDSDYSQFCTSFRKKLNGWFAEIVPDQPPATTEERREFLKQVRRRFDEFCRRQSLEHGKPVVGEKTTETVHHLNLVEELYPGVRKVAVLRDPRDRLVSFHFHQIRKGRFAAESPILSEEIDAYVDRVKKDYEGLLQLAAPYHLLTYEQLQQSPISVIQSLLEFLGVAADPVTARNLEKAARFESLSGRERGQADAGSHFRNGQIGDWHRRLTPAQSAQIVRELESRTRSIEERFGLDLSGYRRPDAEPDRRLCG